ncbi:unnamed protein product, partial [Staurois parvus]
GAGIGSPGIRSFGSTAGSTASSRQGSGLRINRHGQWAPGHQYQIVWLDSGHWVTRHQVIWLASVHRVIWQGSGHRVTRHWIVWLDSGASGHQASGHLARQRAPRHLARQWAPSHQVRQRALSQLARQSEHRIRYRIIWINSGGIESTG